MYSGNAYVSSRSDTGPIVGVGFWGLKYALRWRDPSMSAVVVLRCHGGFKPLLVLRRGKSGVVETDGAAGNRRPTRHRTY